MATIRREAFTRLLATLPRGRLLDLACGHGAFSVAARELGWEVTAVDARTARMPGTEGIEWVQADVRDFPVEGYDCIAVLGLLYHLELPAQIDLLRRCAPTPTLLDTHVARQPEVRQEGYEGIYFDELAGRTQAEWRHSGTASWGNEKSFWATEESLNRLLHDCGFRFVWTLTPWYMNDRTFWLCL